MLTVSDLEAFSATFSTTSSAPMFHIRNVTPIVEKHEASLTTPIRNQISKNDLLQIWHTLNTAQESSVSLIALGNPHFSFEELITLATLCPGANRHVDVSVVVITRRHNDAQAAKSGALSAIEQFAAQIPCDACWCMIGEPIATPKGGHIITNSQKYAHCAPGEAESAFWKLAGMPECVDGRRVIGVPEWLVYCKDPKLLVQ